MDAAQILIVDLVRDGRHVREGKPASQLARAQVPGELQQTQWVAMGLCDDPVPNLLVEVSWDCGFDQGARVLVTKPGEGQVRQIRKELVVRQLSDRNQKEHGLGQQSPTYKAEYLS